MGICLCSHPSPPSPSNELNIIPASKLLLSEPQIESISCQVDPLNKTKASPDTASRGSIDEAADELFSGTELSEELKEEYADYVYKSRARYTGEVKEGRRHGLGTMTWSGGVQYTGNWQEGMPKGEGTMTFQGCSFQGNWSNPGSVGTEEVVKAQLQGLEEWLQACNEGYCKLYSVWLWYIQRKLPEGSITQLSNDQLYRLLELKIKAIRLLLAQGTEAFQTSPELCHFSAANGYFGCTQEGLPHGIGRKAFNGGCFYEGEWVDGLMHGVGVYQWTEQKKRIGLFKQGKCHGLSAFLDKGINTYSLWVNGKEVRTLPLVSS